MRNKTQFVPPEDLSEGYQLKERNGVWQLSFSVRGEKQQRMSLRTKDRAEAERLGYARWVHACMTVSNGLSLTKTVFADVAEEFIRQLEKEVEQGRRGAYQLNDYPPLIRRYFINYFGPSQMKAIKARDIDDYWEWRRDYWTTGPGSSQPYIEYQRTVKGRTSTIKRSIKKTVPDDNTLSKESFLLKQILAFAVRKGHADAMPPFDFNKSRRLRDKSRPGFTLDEFNHLLAVSEARIAETHINGHVRKDRMRLHAFCMISGLTGMRPTEMFNLTWGDIETRRVQLQDDSPKEVAVIMGPNGQVKGRVPVVRPPIFHDVLIFHARGKGKSRETAVMPEVLTPLNVLRNLFLLEQGREPEKQDPVFTNLEGKAIRTFKSGLTPLLIAAELRNTADGRTRDSFSFRHLYFTQQLHENVNQHMLARNGGTSTKMIDAFYSKIRPTDEVKMLTPDWYKHRLF